MSKLLAFSFVLITFVVTVIAYNYRVKNFQDKYEYSLNEQAKLTSDNAKLKDENLKLTNENTSLHQKISLENQNLVNLQFKNNKLQSENKDLQLKIQSTNNDQNKQTVVYKCNICKDTHKVDCTPCNGRGTFDEKCEQCKGKGFIIHTNCGGTGVIICDYCKGKKFHRGEWRDCPRCDGYGNAPCGCQNNGKPICNKCNGSKTTIVKCKTCKGKGTMDCICTKKDVK